jgi:hypothetical protein
MKAVSVDVLPVDGRLAALHSSSEDESTLESWDDGETF